MTQLPQRILTKNKEGQLLGLGTWQKLQGASLILPVLPFSVAKRIMLYAKAQRSKQELVALPFSVAKRIMLYAKAQRSKQELVGPAMSVYIEGAGQGIEQAGNHYSELSLPYFWNWLPKKFYFF